MIRLRWLKDPGPTVLVNSVVQQGARVWLEGFGYTSPPTGFDLHVIRSKALRPFLRLFGRPLETLHTSTQTVPGPTHGTYRSDLAATLGARLTARTYAFLDDQENRSGELMASERVHSSVRLSTPSPEVEHAGVKLGLGDPLIQADVKLVGAVDPELTVSLSSDANALRSAWAVTVAGDADLFSREAARWLLDDLAGSMSVRGFLDRLVMSGLTDARPPTATDGPLAELLRAYPISDDADHVEPSQNALEAAADWAALDRDVGFGRDPGACGPRRRIRDRRRFANDRRGEMAVIHVEAGESVTVPFLVQLPERSTSHLVARVTSVVDGQQLDEISGVVTLQRDGSQLWAWEDPEDQMEIPLAEPMI